MLLANLTSLEFSKKQKLFTEMEKYIGNSSRILVAVSGGVDSMLLSHLLYEYFLEKEYSLDNLFFVHFNHKLRLESEKEQEFVVEYFEKKIEVIEKKVVEHKEDAMRKWRYHHIDFLCKKHHIDYVCMGHHLNDRIESSFLHLLRGANLQGFLSMQYCENHHFLTTAKILRPLLSLNKGEILEIAEHNNIPFVQDQSNFNPEISKRNKLRNTIFPPLFEMSHKYTKTENTFLTSMLNVYTTIEQQLSLSRDQSTYQLKKIILSPYWYAERGYQLLGPIDVITEHDLLNILKNLSVAQNVSKKNLLELLEFITHKKSGHKFLNGVSFFIAHAGVYLIKASRNFWRKYLDVGIKPLLFHDVYAQNIPDGAILRYPQEGDVFNGMSWNRYCIKNKIPVFWRNFLPVVVKDGKIFSFDIFDKIYQKDYI